MSIKTTLTFLGIIIAVIVLVLTVSYKPDPIMVIPISHELKDTSNNTIIVNRIITILSKNNSVYFLSYDGYGKYDIKDKKLLLLPIKFKGDVLPKYVTKKFYNLQTLDSFDDFSLEDRQSFNEMLNLREGNAGYHYPYYFSGYESTMIDLQRHYLLTNNVRGVTEDSGRLYIYNVYGFLIVDLYEDSIKGYFDTSISGVSNESIFYGLKTEYGDKYTPLNGLDDFSQEELRILWGLRKKYLAKMPSKDEAKKIYPLEFEDMRRVMDVSN